MSKLGGRKAVLAYVVAATAVTLHGTVGLTDNVANVLMVVVVSFSLGNVLEHVSYSWRKKKLPGSGVAEAEVGIIKEKVDALEQTNGTLAVAVQDLATKGAEGTIEIPEALNVQLQALSNQAALSSKSLKSLLGKIDHLTTAAGFTKVA